MVPEATESSASRPLSIIANVDVRHCPLHTCPLRSERFGNPSSSFLLTVARTPLVGVHFFLITCSVDFSSPISLGTLANRPRPGTVVVRQFGTSDQKGPSRVFSQPPTLPDLYTPYRRIGRDQRRHPIKSRSTRSHFDQGMPNHFQSLVSPVSVTQHEPRWAQELRPSPDPPARVVSRIAASPRSSSSELTRYLHCIASHTRRKSIGLGGAKKSVQ